MIEKSVRRCRGGRRGPGRRPALGALMRRLCQVRHLAVVAGLVAAAVLLAGSAANAAEPGAGTVLAAESVEAVVNNIRTWLLAILAGVATLFLTVGGLRLMWANGDPGEAEKGKTALKSAAIGYALALLAPLIVTIVGTWVA